MWERLPELSARKYESDQIDVHEALARKKMKYGGSFVEYIAVLERLHCRLEPLGQNVSEVRRVSKLLCSLPK